MSISSMYKAPLSFSDVLTPVGAEREWTADGNSTSGDSEVELSINKNLFEVSGTGYQLTQEQIDLFCSATKKLLMPNTTSWGELEELEEELVAAGSDERFFVLALETGTFPCYVWDRDDSSTSVMLLSHYTEFNGESLSLFYRGNCRFYNTMTGNGTRLPMIMFFYDEQGRTENGEDVVEYHPGNYEVPVCIVYGIPEERLVNYVRATEPPGAILRKIAIQRITNNHNIPEGYSFDHDHVTEFAELLSHQLDMDELPEILIEEAFEIMKAGSAKIRAASNIEELWEAMADDEE